MLVDSDINLNLISASQNGVTHRQYGTGQHAGASQKIYGSLLISFMADTGCIAPKCHLVVEGSIQWVIEKNSAAQANILHLGRIAVQTCRNSMDNLVSIVNSGRCGCILLTSFGMTNDNSRSVLKCVHGSTLTQKSWKEVKIIIDRVHKHVCIHATLTNFDTLFEQNDLQNDGVAKISSMSWIATRHVVQHSQFGPVAKCLFCPCLKMSMKSLAVDHFHSDFIRLSHVMDTVKHFSTAYVVPNASAHHSAMAFESCWLKQFWTLLSICADKAFTVDAFALFCKECDIKREFVPPRRPSRIAIKSKHGIIFQIFLMLKDAHSNSEKEVLAIELVSISSDLYGISAVSAFTSAKGFTKFVDRNIIHGVFQLILEAQQKLVARRRLALNLKCRSCFEENVSARDMIEVYQYTGTNKKGVWSRHKIFFAVDDEAHSVALPGKSGYRVTVAVEDFVLVLHEESFAIVFRMAHNDIDESTTETEEHIIDYDNVHGKNFGGVCTSDYDADFPGETQLVYQQTTLLMTLLMRLD